MKQKVVIIGAGPAGLSFALSLANSNLEIMVIEKSSLESIKNPQYDGREIALTITSVKILEKLKVWQEIDNAAICPIKGAKVLNGDSKYALDFNDGKNSLGYLVSNHLIRKALFERASKFPNIKIITDLSVEEIKNNDQFISVFLSDKTIIKSSLAVAADSRFSESRRKMNISADMHDFARTMVLCKIEHSKPHNNIALEWFDYKQVVALLPTAKNNVSSLVITLPTNAAKQIDDQEVLNIAKNFTENLGEIKLIG